MLGREGITVLEQPEPLPGLGGITDIAVGDRHVLAVDDTGQVWLWGTFLDELIPVPEPVLPAEGIVAVAAGEGTAFGLRTDGSVIGWGATPLRTYSVWAELEICPIPRSYRSWLESLRSTLPAA